MNIRIYIQFHISIMSQYPSQNPSSRRGISHGSSTGSPGDPLGLRDTSSSYDPATSGYNSATGARYSKSSPSNSYDQMAGQDDRIQYAPSTIQRAQVEDETNQSRSERTSENVGKGARGVAASVHVRFPILARFRVIPR